MRLPSLALAAVTLLLLCATPDRAEARSYISFGYYGPGISIHVGRYPRYYYGGYYRYRPYHYRRYYYRPYYYRPYYRRSYRRVYRRRAYGRSCSTWSRRCAANWGYRNRNYYGCMRHHRCR